MTEKARRIRAPHLAKVPRLSDELLAEFWAETEPDSKARRKISAAVNRCKLAISAARLRHYHDGDDE